MKEGKFAALSKYMLKMDDYLIVGAYQPSDGGTTIWKYTSQCGSFKSEKNILVDVGAIHTMENASISEKGDEVAFMAEGAIEYKSNES